LKCRDILFCDGQRIELWDEFVALLSDLLDWRQSDPKDADGQGHIALRNMKNVTWRDSLNTKLHAKPREPSGIHHG